MNDNAVVLRDLEATVDTCLRASAQQCLDVPTCKQ